MKANKASVKDLKNAAARRLFLEKELKVKLAAISQMNFTDADVAGHNIENLIGSTQIPLGIAGPIAINYPLISKLYYLPLATTEGALVASISRGAKAITTTGGAIVTLNTVGITRGPVFKTKNITHSHDTQKLIAKNLPKLQVIAKATSSHIKLTKIDINFVGKNLYCRFYFDTTDAMGMNMATFASQEICEAIEKLTGATLISLAGNYDTDKKPSWLNFINGRGKQVWAEITLTKKIVKEILKTTPEKVVQIVQTKQHLGSLMSGSLGMNAHFANIIAAIFIATGQDPAHVVEGSIGITTAEVETNGNLYFSIYLPSLIIGTVGGGTPLPTQTEALKIIGAKDANELARVIGAAVLAGELSLTASLAQGSLAHAHKTLARKKS
ncbi:hydroxymethylglutaryl-CoA reductase [Candidatus Curtissbacteria bacterium]|nr:hydroxymethylglutaryl-CoA reductase [Candidatus Curtissbacteria bacterium]